MWSILNDGIGRSLFICNFSLRSPTRQDHMQKYFSFFNLMQTFSCISQSSEVFPLRVSIRRYCNLKQLQNGLIFHSHSKQWLCMRIQQTLLCKLYLLYSTCDSQLLLCDLFDRFQSILSAVYLEELKYPNDSMNWRKSRMLSWMHSFVENWQWMCRALTKWVNGS